MSKSELFSVSSMTFNNFSIKSFKREFSTLISDKVANVYLMNNRIEKLSHIFAIQEKNYEHLVELDLSQNLLNLDDSLNQLKYFDCLRFLSLSRNGINKLKNNVFDELVHLEFLLLDQNSLDLNDEESCFSFSKLSRLKMLSLSKNTIQRLPDNFFDNLVNLTHLDMSYNQLSSIDRKIFSMLISLEMLSLKSNLISSIEQDSFSKILKLKTINLKKNKLTELNHSLFFGLTNLKSIKIDNNVLISSVDDSNHI
jgi:hypothetical protein